MDKAEVMSRPASRSEPLCRVVVAYIASAWPGMIVGLGIFFMNLDAARE